MTSIKEQSIKDFMTNYDFRDDDWSVNEIKQEMRSFLGEEPGIEVVYKKDVRLNESTRKSETFHNLKKIEIVFYDTDNRFKKLSFKIDKNL